MAEIQYKYPKQQQTMASTKNGQYDSELLEVFVSNSHVTSMNEIMEVQSFVDSLTFSKSEAGVVDNPTEYNSSVEKDIVEKDTEVGTTPSVEKDDVEKNTEVGMSLARVSTVSNDVTEE